MFTATEEIQGKLDGALCFVIDSPMNALVASIIGRRASRVDVIYAFDPERKDVDEYLSLTRELLADLPVTSEGLIAFDSARFWGGEKNLLIPAAQRSLLPMLKAHALETRYFGNCLTNPVALALKRHAKVNHLYHAPGDFVSMLFPQESPLKSSFKNLVKRILGLALYKIEVGDFPIYSLLNFASQKNFQHLDFNDFSSKDIENGLAELSRELDVPGKNIMLLLAGDEPEPGDKNSSNIAKYLKPHYEAVEILMKTDGLDSATLWIKEHKSYLPLTSEERALLAVEFSKLGCSVRFVADLLPENYRPLPGECILKYGKVDYVVAEPSAFLFNIASSSVIPIAAVTPFAPYRDNDQQGRNAEFMAINHLLVRPGRVY